MELELHMAASPAVSCKSGRGFLAHRSQTGPCSQQHMALGAGTCGRDALILSPPSSALRESPHPSFPPTAGPGTSAPGIIPSTFQPPCPNGELDAHYSSLAVRKICHCNKLPGAEPFGVFRWSLDALVEERARPNAGCAVLWRRATGRIQTAAGQVMRWDPGTPLPEHMGRLGLHWHSRAAPAADGEAGLDQPFGGSHLFYQSAAAEVALGFSHDAWSQAHETHFQGVGMHLPLQPCRGQSVHAVSTDSAWGLQPAGRGGGGSGRGL